ncbi:hypothetical protein K7W42_07610 [Deinococcus sp. HMF7604]|uniref:hypothetical protein n=1 Tax=Deinococcus betulae TaxID=2873312 RepID=UPI001CCEA6BC|nr:hypothetical protein [Deinococcus betulae]MBZ9750725.1 hypothetical protein [Deinococcus betulae]
MTGGRTPGRRSPRALIPGAVSLAAAQVIPASLTASGRPALALACYTTRHTVTLTVLPAGVCWALSAPPALPNARDELEGLTLARLGGARFTVEHDGRRQVLDVPAVRVLRELVEALGLYDGQPVNLGAAS